MLLHYWTDNKNYNCVVDLKDSFIFPSLWTVANFLANFVQQKLDNFLRAGLGWVENIFKVLVLRQRREISCKSAWLGLPKERTSGSGCAWHEQELICTGAKKGNCPDRVCFHSNTWKFTDKNNFALLFNDTRQIIIMKKLLMLQVIQPLQWWWNMCTGWIQNKNKKGD